MNLSYILNKQSEIVRPISFKDIAVEVLPNEYYETPRIFADDFYFFRFQINLDMDAETEGVQSGITQENIEVYYQDTNKSEDFAGTANGMYVKVPFGITGATAFLRSSVIYSDGDIPIYNEDFRIRVKNKSDKPILVRNVTLRLLK